MALIETSYNQDLQSPVVVHHLHGNVFSQDNQGNLIGVNIFDGGSPATLSGTVTAYAIRADGATVPVNGVLNGNSCYAILNSACYEIEGILSIVIKLESGGSTTTLCAVVAYVYRSITDSAVDPSSIIPSVQDLIEAIDEAVASIPPDYSGLIADVESRSFSIDLIQNKAKNSCQYLKESTSVNGEFWFINSNNEIASYSGTNCKRYARVLLYAGVKYTFANVYGYFTVFSALDGISSMGRLTNDQSDTPLTVEYTPQHDCYVYVTRNIERANILRQPTMLVLGTELPTVYTEGIYKREFVISAKDCGEFVQSAYQYLEESKSVDNSCWNWSSDGHIGLFEANNTKRYERVLLKAGRKYKIWNAYGYFTIFCDYDGNVIGRLSDTAFNDPVTKTYTPQTDCYVYVTVNKEYVGNKHAMVTDSVIDPVTYGEGVYCALVNQREIHVIPDGTGDFTSVVDAVNYANALSGSYDVNIYIHTGTYDILQELGGQSFIDSLDNWTYELQGLRIQRNNVNLIGVGYPQLAFRLPDTVTRQQSERCSCLNLTYYSARIENLVLIAKNCRYVIHDEGNNYTIPIHRVMKNLRCIHEGNKSGLWAYPSVLGGGNTGGSTYDIINCQFITDNYMQALSYHCNSGQEPSKYNVDGCVGLVNSSGGISFRFSYMGSATPVGKVVVNLKNCSGNARVVVEPEISGNPDDTPNFIELYNNGFEVIQ